ncbi:MAG TPA: hypothetical protein VGL22_02450 [Terracidiphilus sp.]
MSANKTLRVVHGLAVVVLCSAFAGPAQVPSPDVQEQMRRLNAAVNRVQAQIDQSQRELAELKNQLSAMQGGGTLPEAVENDQPGAGAAELQAAVSGLRETQSVHEAQLATIEQIKVESESKYPLTVSGMILMTGISSTQAVDGSQSPVIAVHGPGSTSATIRQTILGIDARGPHLLGAVSHADAHFDFWGNTGASGYNSDLGLFRMRTAHAQLDWAHSTLFFSLDRPLMSPDAPTSLTAVAVPALAWSGTLWAWNPQMGASHDFFTQRRLNLRGQAALIDVADPAPIYPSSASGSYSPPSTTDQSRWPGVQARLSVIDTDNEGGAHIGFSGYFAPHRLPQPRRFDSWAGVVDFDLPVTRMGRFTGSAYTGQALGGLGEGAFKDYVAQTYHGEWYFRALDDMGGWLQWKQKPSQRLEFNEAFGIDNVPAHQIRPYTATNADSYYNLARNRTFTANVIYSPSAYLLFSLEYRRIASSFVNSPTEFSDIIGLGAGYKF